MRSNSESFQDDCSPPPAATRKSVSEPPAAAKRPRIEAPSPLPTFKVKSDPSLVSVSIFEPQLAGWLRRLFLFLLMNDILDFTSAASSMDDDLRESAGLLNVFSLFFPPLLAFALQVRKEKLGDRITALQQLVSPFGKVLVLSLYASIPSHSSRRSIYLAYGRASDARTPLG